MVTELAEMHATGARDMAMPHPELTLDLILPVEFDPAGLTQEHNALIDAAYTSQMGRDYQKAITYYTKAIESDPQVAGVYINRAAAYESIGDLERALQDLDEALTLESKPEARSPSQSRQHLLH